MRLHSPREAVAWLSALGGHWRNARGSRERLEAKQRRKFRKLVTFLRGKSSYYRDIMERRGIDPAVCVPEDFPVLTKDAFLDNFARIVTDPRITQDRVADFLSRSPDPRELFENEFHVLHTSGTSGTVGYFVYSHNEWIKGSSHIVRLVPLGIRKRIAYVAATRGHFAGVSLTLTGTDGTNELFFDVRTFDVNQPMPQLIDALSEFQPRVLSGYAAILKVLARAQEQGRLRISPSLLVNGGEPLLSDDRPYLEHVFQAPVANVYASSEHLYMGIQFPESEGMYLLEDDLLFEFHDDHTCVTNLYNYTTPLIRYRMDDMMVPDPNGPRIYPFTKIKEVLGRYEDALLFANKFGEEDFIHPIVIVELHVKGLHSWQIVLIDKTSFLCRVQFEAGLTEEEKCNTTAALGRKLRAILTEKDMDGVRFGIQEVDALPIDKRSGKFRLVVQDATAASELVDLRDVFVPEETKRTLAPEAAVLTA